MVEQLGLSVSIDAEMARFERAMQDAGRLVETTTSGMDRQTKRAAQAFSKLEGALDPAGRALTRLERDTIKVQQALDRGAVTAERAAALQKRLNDQYEAAVAKINGVTAAQNRTTAAAEQVTAAVVRNETMLGRLTSGMGNAGGVAQQAGYQIADLATQISMGGNAMQAFAVQGGQLISMMGPWGAAIGTVVTVGGLLAATMLDAEDAAKDAEKGADDYKGALDELAAQQRRNIELQEQLSGAFRSSTITAIQAQLDEFKRARDRVFAAYKSGDADRADVEAATADVQQAFYALRDAQRAQRQELELGLAIERKYIEQEKALTSQLASGSITALEYSARLEALKYAQQNNVEIGGDLYQQALDNARASGALKEQTDALTGSTDKAAKAAKEATSQLDELRQKLDDEIEAVGLSAEENERLGYVRDAQAAALEDYNAGIRDTPLLYAAEIEQINASVDALQARREAQEAATEADRKAKEAIKDAERAWEQYGREIDRVAEDIAGDWAESIYNGLTGNGDDILSWFKSLFKRIAIEAIKAQIVLPIATQVVGAVPGLFGIKTPSGTAAGGSGAGGMGVGIGDLSSIGNLFSGSSSLYNIGSSIATSGFGQTIGMSTLQSGAAHSLGVAAVPGGLSNAAGTPVMTGFGSTFAEGLSASPWGIVGSIGANLLFDDLNPVGSTIGGIVGSVGGGMAGSALLGSILGAAGGPVGAILGSSLGTALGGQIGGGVPHPGASYEAEVGTDGRLRNPSILSKHMGTEQVTQLGSALEQYTQALTKTLRGATLTGNVGATIDETAGRTAFLTRGGSATGLESMVREDGVRFYDFDPKDEASQSRAIARLTIDMAANAEGLSEATRRVVDNLIAAAGANEDLSAQTVDSALYLSENWSAVMTQMRAGVGDLRSAITDEAVTAIDQMIEQVKDFQDTVNAGFGAGSAEATEAAAALRDAVAIFAGLKDAGDQMTAVEAQMAQLEARYAELPRLFEAVGHSAEEAAELAAEAYQRTVTKIRDGVNQTMGLGILQMLDPSRAAVYQATLQLDAMRKDVEASGADMDLFRQYEALTLMRAAESEAIKAQTQQLQASSQAFAGMAATLRQTRLALLINGNLSPLAPRARMDEAARQFEDISRRARLGDTDAMAQLSDISRSYLEVARGFYASSEDYARIFDAVSSTLQDTETVAERHARIAQEQLDAIEQSNRHLEAMQAALGALGLSQNRKWSAQGYEQHQTANKVLADALGYGGAFGSGGFDAWIRAQDEDTKARARAILNAFGQDYRIGFANGGSFMVDGPGGVDNLSLPQLRVTRGEIVNVSRGDHMAGLLSEARATNAELGRLVRVTFEASKAQAAELASVRGELAEVRRMLGRVA